MIRSFALAVFFTLLTSAAFAQTTTIDATERAAALAGVARQIEQNYVFPQVGKQMADAIRKRAQRGEYNAVTDGPQLARLLTQHLREVGKDLHVAVQYSPERLPAERTGQQQPSAEEVNRFKSDLARDNYGFRKTEILPGNVGYIKLDLFAPPEYAGETYAAAMAFVANTDALIIDLRDNGGAISPDAIPMFSTYFFAQPVHLIDLKWNTEETARQLWSWGYVPGRRYLDQPVYILTSRRTFSGAEEFAYDLKNLKRATIVGDTTGGGANPGGTRRASDHFGVFVPFGRVTSPITRTNWEGVGVLPDIATAPARALLVAQREALDKLLANAKDERARGALTAARSDVESRLARFRTITFELSGYDQAKQVFVAGSFNSWSPSATPLARQGDKWVARVDVEPGRVVYKFIVDGEWLTDPANRETEGTGQFTNSVRVVP
ncbi:MAG TPA: S41 family peptidase [Longimicrobiales bacterium]